MLLRGLAGLAAAMLCFAGGFYFCFTYLRFGVPQLERSSLAHSHELPNYSVADFERANENVAEFLDSRPPDVLDMKPAAIVVPDRGNYAIYWSSGRPGVRFPDDLRGAAREVIERALRGSGP